jgi:preprotein translocase subunit SecA
MNRLERLLGVENLFTEHRSGIVHMVEQALRAHNFYKRDDEYVVTTDTCKSSMNSPGA